MVAGPGASHNSFVRECSAFIACGGSLGGVGNHPEQEATQWCQCLVRHLPLCSRRRHVFPGAACKVVILLRWHAGSKRLQDYS